VEAKEKVKRQRKFLLDAVQKHEQFPEMENAEAQPGRHDTIKQGATLVINKKYN
jgi:hypothetical protein